MPAPRRRTRVLVWLVWPALVVVLTVSVIHFLRYRMGWDIYWSWSPLRLLVALLVALVLPVAFELAVRRRADAAATRRGGSGPGGPGAGSPR